MVVDGRCEVVSITGVRVHDLDIIKSRFLANCFISVTCSIISVVNLRAYPLKMDCDARLFSQDSSFSLGRQRFIEELKQYVNKTPQSLLMIKLQVISYYLNNQDVGSELIGSLPSHEEISFFMNGMNRAHSAYQIAKKSDDLHNPASHITSLVKGMTTAAIEEFQWGVALAYKEHLSYQLKVVPLETNLEISQQDIWIDSIFVLDDLAELRMRFIRLGEVIDSYFSLTAALELFRSHREYYRVPGTTSIDRSLHLQEFERNATRLLFSHMKEQGIEDWELSIFETVYGPIEHDKFHM